MQTAREIIERRSPDHCDICAAPYSDGYHEKTQFGVCEACLVHGSPPPLMYAHLRRHHEGLHEPEPWEDNRLCVSIKTSSGDQYTFSTCTLWGDYVTFDEPEHWHAVWVRCSDIVFMEEKFCKTPRSGATLFWQV